MASFCRVISCLITNKIAYSNRSIHIGQTKSKVLSEVHNIAKEWTGNNSNPPTRLI